MKKRLSLALCAVLFICLFPVNSYAGIRGESVKYVDVVEKVKKQEKKEEAPVVDTISVQLPVVNILQNPELPNGCEVTSLAIVLNYIGIPADKCDLSDNYLPKSDTLEANPDELYLREPRSNGFYCFTGPLITCVNNYNAANGYAVSTSDLTGEDVSSLYSAIDNGHPVIVWGTLRWNSPVLNELGLYRNLHCMVLAGYTDSKVTIIDPIYDLAYRTINRSTFEKIWKKMGSKAMYVY